jgi:hypothetical protein
VSRLCLSGRGHAFCVEFVLTADRVDKETFGSAVPGGPFLDTEPALRQDEAGMTQSGGFPSFAHATASGEVAPRADLSAATIAAGIEPIPVPLAAVR